MKFLNSNYGYANFAKGSRTSGGTSRRSGGNEAANSKRPGRTGNTPAAKVTTNGPDIVAPAKRPANQGAGAYSSKNPNMWRGENASKALSPANGPQPFYGPQQKKGKLGNLKDAVEGKAQYYGAKGKNMLAKAGKFISNNKVGVGLAAAGALGAAGAGLAIRKMRSDKGKKRGNYN
jgi:hypothetical protein